MSDEIDRRIHEAVALARFEDRLINLEQRMDKVDEIYEMMVAAKGGWKTLVIGGTIGVALSTLVLKILSLIKGVG